MYGQELLIRSSWPGFTWRAQVCRPPAEIGRAPVEPVHLGDAEEREGPEGGHHQHPSGHVPKGAAQRQAAERSGEMIPKTTCLWSETPFWDRR